MAEMAITEDRLKELIDESVQKHFKLTFEDMDEVRRSPGAAIVRVETRLDAIEKNMVTKADFANLEARVEAMGKNMATKADIANLETLVGSLEKNSATKTDIANLRSELGERIGKLEIGMKIISAIFISMLGAVIAMLVKLVFFS